MADFDGFVPATQASYLGTPRQAGFRAGGLVPELGGTPITTYYYRTGAGASGSTTDVGSIPVGATVERVTTS